MKRRKNVASTKDDRAKALAFLEWIGDAFDKTGVEAVLIGGQARNFWAEPRTTFDFDFTVTANATALESIQTLLLEQGYRVVRDQGARQSSGPDFLQLTNSSTGDSVDIQAAKTDFQVGIIARGVRLDPNQPVPVATVEDLLVLKLIANRRKDQGDLFELMVLPGLDWDYIHRWTAEHGTRALLNEIRASIPPLD